MNLSLSLTHLSLRRYLCIACSDKQIDMKYLVLIEILQVDESNKINRSEGGLEIPDVFREA